MVKSHETVEKIKEENIQVKNRLMKIMLKMKQKLKI